MTQIGSATLDLKASTARALADIRKLGSDARTALAGVTDLKVKATVQVKKPTAGELRTALEGVTGSINAKVVPKKPSQTELRAALTGVSVTLPAKLEVKPLSQSQLNAALRGVAGEKNVTVKVDGEQAKRQLTNIKALIDSIKNTAKASLQINTTGLNALLTATTNQIGVLRGLIGELRQLGGNRGGGAGGGNTGGSGSGGGSGGNLYSNQLRGLQGDLRSGALGQQQFEQQTRALITSINSEITSLRNLGVLTREQQNRLDSLRGTAGQASEALRRMGQTGAQQGIAQLGRELDIANGKFGRGELTLREYLREQQRIEQAARQMGTGLQAGSREAQQLERVLTGLQGATRNLNTQSINKLKLDLAEARTRFDQATAAARTFAERNAAIRQYQQDVNGLTQRIEQLGRRTTLTAQQTRELVNIEGQLARQQSTLQGTNSPIGLGGNVLTALREAFPLIQSAGGSLGAAASQGQAFGGALGGIAAKLGPVGIAIGAAVVTIGLLVAGITKAVEVSGKFQAIMADVQARTRDASQPVEAFSGTLKQLSAAAMNFGQPLGIGASEAASGILELTKAGLSAQDVLAGGLKASMDLAGSAGEDLATASTQAVAAMTAFGLKAADLPHVADVFANFAGKTFLSATDLTQAIAAVGPVARSSGLGIEQLGGVMATLANGGFRNMSDAGTSLKTLLLSLEAPSDTAAKAMKAIHFSAFDAAGNIKPLTQSIGEIRAKLIQLTPQAQKHLLKDIFGTDAVRAAEILLREGPAAIDANTKAMGKQGEAARVAKERLDSLQGSQKKLGAAFEILSVKIGAPFLGPLKAIVDGFTSVVLAFSKGSDAISSGAGAVGQYATTIQQIVQPVIGVLQSVFGVLAYLWTNVGLPIVSVIGTTFSVVFQGVGAVLSVLLNVVSGVVKGVLGFFGGLASGTAQHLTGVKFSLADVAAAFSRWAGTARAYIVGVGKVGGLLPPLFQSVGTSLGRIFSGIGEIFAGFGLLAYDRLVKPVLPIVGAIKSAFMSVANTIGNVVSSVVSFVGEKFQPLVSFMQSIGINIGNALTTIAGNIGGAIRNLVGNAADAFQQQADAQAAAALAASKESGALDLIKKGAADVISGVQDARTATTAFGTGASQAIAGVTKELAASTNQARLLKASLSIPTPTVPSALASGGGTLSDIGLGPKPKKPKKPAKPKQPRAAPVTAADLVAMDEYKKKLDGMNLADLQREKLLQVRLGNKAKERAVLAEINQRERENASATAASSKEAERQGEVRKTLVRELRQAISVFKLQDDQNKVTAASQLAFNNRIEDFRARIAKLPPELQKGLGVLVEQAAQLSKNATLHSNASKLAKQQASTADNLKRAIGQLNDRFALQAQQGAVTASSLQAYQQRMETFRAAVAKLPAPLQAILKPLLDQAPALVKAGQGVLNYRSELDNLRKSVEGMTLAQLEEARARVVVNGGDQKKLDILDAEIKKHKTVSDLQAQQAHLESQQAVAKGDRDGVLADYEDRKAAAEGNLAALYQLELEFGSKVQAARDAEARAQAASEIQQVNEKYGALLALEGLSASRRQQLEQDRANALGAIYQGLTTTYLQNNTARNKAELDAKNALDDALVSVDRSTRQTILQNSVDALQRQTQATEARRDDEFAAENLSASQKLLISKNYEGLLDAQKSKEIEGRRRLEQQAESDRYADALQSAKDRLGSGAEYLKAQVQLEAEHASNVKAINGRLDDELRDYRLARQQDVVKAQQQKATDDKQALAQQVSENKEAADQVVTTTLDGLSEMTGAQRAGARTVLEAWRITYQGMGEAGKAALASIDAALKKLDDTSNKARAKAAELLVDPDRATADFNSREFKRNDPLSTDQARSEAEGKFKPDLDFYRDGLADIATALKDFEGGQLSDQERMVRDGLLAQQQLYQQFFDNIQLEALQAGDKAAADFVQGQLDGAANAQRELVEARHQLALVDEVDDADEYRAGLLAYREYWGGRVEALKTALEQLKPGTAEYIATQQQLIAATNTLTQVNKDLAQADSSTAAEEKRIAKIRAKTLEDLSKSFDEAAKHFSRDTPLSALTSGLLEGVGKFFEAGGGSQGILSGAAAFVGALLDVFKTGDDDFDAVLGSFVQGAQSILQQLASGNWIGALIAGIATVVNSIIGIFTYGARSAQKAADEISNATKDIKIFDVSKYTKVVSNGGISGFFGGVHSEINQVALDVAKTLGDAIYNGVSGGLLDGLKAGKTKFSEVSIDIKAQLAEGILQGIIDGFLNGEAFKKRVQPYLDAYLNEKDPAKRAALAGQLQDAIKGANSDLQDLYENVLVPVSKDLGYFGSDGSSSAPEGSISALQQQRSQLETQFNNATNDADRRAIKAKMDALDQQIAQLQGNDSASSGSGLSALPSSSTDSPITIGGGDVDATSGGQQGSITTSASAVGTQLTTAGTTYMEAAQLQKAAVTEFGEHVARMGEHVDRLGQVDRAQQLDRARGAVRQGLGTNWSTLSPF